MKKRIATAANAPDSAQAVSDKLQAYQQRIANILESFTDAFFEVDSNWTVTYFNKEAERILQIPRDEIIGKNLWDKFPAAIPLKFYSEYHRAIEENISVRFEEYFVPMEIWLEVAAFPSGSGLSVYFKDITAREEVLKELEREKEKFRSLFNLSPIPQWVFDIKQLNFLDVNEAAIRHYGYSREEFMAMTIKDIRQESEYHALQKILDGHLIPGNFNQSMVKHKKKNGEVILVRIEANSVSFEGREARLVLAMDFTETIKAEQSLAESELRFRSLVQYGSDMIAITDFEGNINYVAPNITSVLNLKVEDLMKSNIFKQVHQLDQDRLNEEFSAIKNEKQIKLSPFRLRNGNRSYRWIETILTNMMNVSSINGIVANARDITELIEHKLKMEESIARYNTVSKATSDAIWDWDMRTGVITWNKGVVGIFGYRNARYDHKWWKKNVHPDDLTGVLEKINAQIAQRKSRLVIEYRFMCSDGNYKSVLDRSFLSYGEQGEPIRLVGSMQDITERINYIKAIEQQNSRLMEISWMQSHAVRAPLARIMGLVRLLDIKGLESQPDQVRLIDYIKSSADELDQVIREILKKTI